MAVVLDAFVPYLKRMIMDMAEDELRMQLGVSGEIERLGDKMASMEKFLANAEKRRIDEPNVQGWVSKLKDAMYEATDILELCQLDAEERQRNRGGCWATMEEMVPNCLRPLLFCLQNPTFAYFMGGRIKALNMRLDDIHNGMAEFQFIPLGSYPLRMAPSDATPPSRSTTSLLDESAIVGDAIERDTNSLVQELLANGPAIKVVSIVGPGGMGKSTLSKKIFNDKAVQAFYKSRIWLSVTESYDEERLLISAIIQAGGEPRGDKQILTLTLAGILSMGKFLLVLDDVWCAEPWTKVLHSPAVEAGL
ncbi:hypothetical protein ACP70R_006551 [Stipagrostis hirtigluma subsp. patula]